MSPDRDQLAVLYYFGDLQYWKLPRIAADALEEGYDGPALRTLAGLAGLTSGEIRAEDIRANEIDSAFCEMGVNAPITGDQARLVLATESAQKALDGRSNVFDEATYVRIHLCKLSEPPESLMRIVNLSKEAKNAPHSRWDRIDADLKDAFADFLRCQKIQVPE
ncbi:MAG: hypothetical protein P4L40_05015 [Terracidiphilus sp.]|nr:hypothetical protein [Terracidiphilus sp.]